MNLFLQENNKTAGFRWRPNPCACAQRATRLMRSLWLPTVDGSTLTLCATTVVGMGSPLWATIVVRTPGRHCVYPQWAALDRTLGKHSVAWGYPHLMIAVPTFTPLPRPPWPSLFAMATASSSSSSLHKIQGTHTCPNPNFRLGQTQYVFKNICVGKCFIGF